MSISTTRIVLKHSTVPGAVPSTGDLLTAELAYNVRDGILYAKKETVGIDTTIQEIVDVGAGPSIPNYIYVTPYGDDSFSGSKLGQGKATIQSALGIATSGTIIRVTPGIYIEQIPLSIPDGVSLIGDDPRQVTITPASTNLPVVFLGDGSVVSNISFRGNPTTEAIFSVNDLVTGIVTITNPPRITNCYNYINNSTGIDVNGGNISGNYKAVIVDGFEHHGEQGIGVSITYGAYCQIKSLYTAFNDKSVYVGYGGVCNISNGNSTYGNYGLIASGVGPVDYIGKSTQTYPENTDTFAIYTLPSNPYDGQVVYFDTLYYTVTRIDISNGGSGYSRRPTVTIDSSPTEWGINASAVATITDGSVTSIDIVSNGRGYTTSPNITISAPDVGINTAIASAIISPTYYTILSATKVVAGVSTITLTESVPFSVLNQSNTFFLKQSRLIASNHTFEYVGTGTDSTTSLPFFGGIPIPENEVISENGGLIIFSSKDQSGNLRLGDGVTINQSTGSMTGDVYTRSIFNNVTPLILALGGE